MSQPEPEEAIFNRPSASRIKSASAPLPPLPLEGHSLIVQRSMEISLRRPAVVSLVSQIPCPVQRWHRAARTRRLGHPAFSPLAVLPLPPPHADVSGPLRPFAGSIACGVHFSKEEIPRGA